MSSLGGSATTVSVNVVRYSGTIISAQTGELIVVRSGGAGDVPDHLLVSIKPRVRYVQGSRADLY